MSAELKNFTPFANMQFTNLDNEGREFGVFMVKTAWDIQEDGICVLSDEQEPFALTDEFHGEINKSAVRYPSDLVPYKPTTDFILNATAFAPNDEEAKKWDVSVQIEEDQNGKVLIDRTLKITGPREWRFLKRRWQLSDPEQIIRLDIRYEHAYGGMIPKGEDDDGNPFVEAYEHNPVGKGFADPNSIDQDQSCPAPQILLPDQELSDPFEHLAPAGFGPIQAAWLPRRPLGGTYDDHWMEHVWPNWPKDYEFGFHNAASEGMKNALPFGAGATITLRNMHPEKEEWVINLPNPNLAAITVQEDEIIYYGLHTDSVFLDVAHNRLSDPRVFVISRMVFDRELTNSIILTRLGSKDNLEQLKMPPAPRQIAKFIEEEIEEVPV